MTVGIEIFKKHFEDCKDQYVVIGGTACFLLLQEEHLDFRATKDLDIVLCVEALNEKFVEKFWSFVHEAGYLFQHRSTGERCFYRFEKPKDSRYPYMIEILSQKPKILTEREPGSIVPMAIGDDIVSLSAILLDPIYYEFIKMQKTDIDGITVATDICIIPLKARAWIDLNERLNNGVSIRGNDIAKHKKDIYRMTQLLSTIALVDVPQSIKNDIRIFVEKIEDDDNLLKQLNIAGLTISEIKRRLLHVYCS